MSNKCCLCQIELKKNMKTPICRECWENEEDIKYVTIKNAKKKYLLTNEDLKDLLLMKCYYTHPGTSIYKLCDVEKKCKETMNPQKEKTFKKRETNFVSLFFL